MSKGRIKKCSLFYLTLKDGTCLPYGIVKINSSLTAIDHTSTCISEKVVTLMTENDVIIDCLKNRDVENQMVFKYKSNIICQENGQLPCKGGQTECYSIREICIYKLNENNLLTPCKTGEQVANCSLIQCNMKFKCPGFYCIPWSYVCDGKWDCPGGYDEVKEFKCGTNRNCSEMFKCKNSQKCIHVGDVRNGLKDCTAGDDEYLCSLSGSLCPSSCFCIGLVIICYNISYVNDLVAVPQYNAIFLSYCNHIFLESLLKILIFPTFLSLRHNQLRPVCTILPNLRNVLTIDLGFNLVEYVKPGCFRNGF